MKDFMSLEFQAERVPAKTTKKIIVMKPEYKKREYWKLVRASRRLESACTDPDYHTDDEIKKITAAFDVILDAFEKSYAWLWEDEKEAA